MTSDPVSEIAAAIRDGRHLLLFSDFDGTLVPIDDTPFECAATPEVREILGRVNNHARAAVGVVSGRDLADLRPRVGVEGIAYAGNHGLEIVGPGLEFREPTAEARSAELAEILADIRREIAGIPGAWVQNKILSASVHFRQTAPDRVPQVQEIVHRLAGPHQDRFVLRDGKMVVEIRPAVDWHKGKAVEWLRDRLGKPDPLCVYLGDDRTDEDAFAALPDGVTVRVGLDQPTSARFRVESSDDIAEILRRIAALL